MSANIVALSANIMELSANIVELSANIIMRCIFILNVVTGGGTALTARMDNMSVRVQFKLGE